MANWLEGSVIDNHHWTDKLYSLKVKVEETYPSFTAGQFTRIGLKMKDGDEIVARPYSLVNSPRDEHLEFYSIVVEDGELSPPLHELKEGDRIYVSDLVTGFLVMDEVPKEHTNIWLMATGTGLGPFLSILSSEQIWQRADRVVLVHGVRYAEELAYQDLIKSIKTKHSGFDYVPFVSREEPPQVAQIESATAIMKGRFPAAMANGDLEKQVKLKMDPDNTHLMLCGNPEMLKDVHEVMNPRGFKRNRRREPGQITTENYW